MIIYVDADGSPVVNSAVEIAKEYQLEIILVKNYAHELHDDYAQVITVDIAQDSADYYIVNKIQESDLVITQDYGLAALCLSKKALAINQSGHLFTEGNIDGMLNRRYIHAKLRRQGKGHSNAKKRKLLEDKQFEDGLRVLIEKNL